MDGDFKRPLGSNTEGVKPGPTGGYDGSSETYEDAEGKPVEVNKSAQTPESDKPKSSRNWKKGLLWTVVVLLLLGAAAAAAWFWYDGQNTKSELSSTKEQLAQAQSDTAAAEAKVDELQTTATAENEAETDAQKIQNAIVLWGSLHKEPVGEYVFDDTKQPEIKDGYAKVSVGFKSGGGATAYLKQSEDSKEWMMLFMDNGGGIPKYINDTFGTPPFFGSNPPVY